MAARSSAAPRSADPELTIERMLDAPRQQVFRAWTETDRAAEWWGPQGFTTLFCEMDVRPGGAWRLRMQSPQGTIHTKRGVYREVVPPERLVFTFAWEDEQGRPKHETVVTLRLDRIGNRTRLVLHQVGFESVGSRDAHGGGWASSLQRLADWLV